MSSIVWAKIEINLSRRELGHPQTLSNTIWQFSKCIWSKFSIRWWSEFRTKWMRSRRREDSLSWRWRRTANPIKINSCLWFPVPLSQPLWEHAAVIRPEYRSSAQSYFFIINITIFYFYFSRLRCVLLRASLDNCFSFIHSISMAIRHFIGYRFTRRVCVCARDCVREQRREPKDNWHAQRLNGWVPAWCMSARTMQLLWDCRLSNQLYAHSYVCVCLCCHYVHHHRRQTTDFVSLFVGHWTHRTVVTAE